MVIDSLGGGLGDLPEDVLGSQQRYLKIGGESIGYEAEELDQVLGQSWAERRAGQTALTPNNDLPGVREQAREAVDPEKIKAEVVRQARWMIMLNEPTLKIEQHLERAMNDGLLTPVEAAEVRSEWPLLGRLYLDRTIASKCADIRKASQHRDARHALYLVMSGDCKECEKQYYGICPQSGRKLIAGVPAGKAELRESCRHLAERGRILSNANINDWNDLKLAMAPQKAEENSRIYPHASPVGPILSQRIDVQQQNTILNDAAIQKQQERDAVHQELDARTVVPVARKIAELLLTGTEWAVAREEVERLFPDNAVVKAAIAFLKRNSNPALLASHLAAFPSLYAGDCHECRDFLRTNCIKVACVFPTVACKDCKWRDNPTRSCSLIGASVLEKTGIGAEAVNHAIDEFRAKGRLVSSQAKGLKEIPDLLRRLSEAVRMAFASTERIDPIRVGRNALVGSADNFASKENLVIWAQDALSKAASVTEIKKELKRHRTDADQVACDALALTRTVHADSLDACLSEKYVFASNAVLVPGEKCSACPHMDQLQCRRHGVAFSMENGPDETNSVSPEAREVLNYYADSHLVADVDPENTKKTIDIQFKNEGAQMTIDLGPSGAITNYQQLYDFLPQSIDISSKKGGAPPLEVQGLGAAEGFDLSGMF